MEAHFIQLCYIKRQQSNWNVKKTIEHMNEAMQSEELESNNETNMCAENTNKLRVRMLLIAKTIPRAHLKRKKRHGMVMFVSISAVKNLHFNLQMHVCSTGSDHQ